ncbi:MAG: HAMP domain-containing sensor histidine kinase, partial [Myxococcota bacterium]
HFLVGEPSLGLGFINDPKYQMGQTVLSDTIVSMPPVGLGRIASEPYVVPGLPGAPEHTRRRLDRPPIDAIEFTPVATRNMIRRARRGLVLGLITTAMMALTTLWLWVVLGRRQRDERELQRQEILASLGKMSAVISHELRNPLAAAMGQTELLAELLPRGPARKDARAAQSELERMERVTNDLLALVNARRIQREATAVVPWVRAILATRGEELFEVTIDPSVDEGSYDDALIDPINLGRALDALVDNALGFDRSGDLVEVRVWVKRSLLHIAVRDHGSGLPRGIKIFEPFVTTRQSRPGLGLPIAREIAYAHGGDIEAADHPNVGAVFTLCVPLGARISAQPPP